MIALNSLAEDGAVSLVARSCWMGLRLTMTCGLSRQAAANATQTR
jgi:hypothetical protein